MLWEDCPRCGTARIGAFRYCRGCGLDYDAVRREPIAAVEPTRQTAPPALVAVPVNVPPLPGEPVDRMPAQPAAAPAGPSPMEVSAAERPAPQVTPAERPAPQVTRTPQVTPGPPPATASEPPSPPVETALPPAPTGDLPSAAPPEKPAPAAPPGPVVLGARSSAEPPPVPAQAMLTRLGFAPGEAPDDDPTPRYLGRDGSGLVAIEVRGDPVAAITITAPAPGSGTGTDRTAGSALAAGAVMVGDPPGMGDWVLGAVSVPGATDGEDEGVFGDVAVRLRRHTGSPPTFTLTYERRPGRS